MNKFIKLLLLVLLGITTAVVAFYFLTAKTLVYHFANNGNMICVEHKDYGIFTTDGDLQCFGIVPVVKGDGTPTTKPLINGEVDLRTK